MKARSMTSVALLFSWLTLGAAYAASEFDGRVEAVHQADVYSRAEGIVVEVLASQGDYVDAGTVLARLQYDMAELAVAAARAGLAETDALLDQANRRLARAERLSTSGSTSEAAAADARTDAALATARRDLAQTALAVAQTQLQDTFVRAPIAGFIEDPRVRVGSLVEFNSGDPPLFEIVNLDPVRVVYDVPYTARLSETEPALEQVAVAEQTGTLQILSDDGRVLKDTISQTASAVWVDAETGSIRMWATVSNPDGLLRPGMQVRVRAQPPRTNTPTSQ